MRTFAHISGWQCVRIKSKKKRKSQRDWEVRVSGPVGDEPSFINAICTTSIASQASSGPLDIVSVYLHGCCEEKHMSGGPMSQADRKLKEACHVPNSWVLLGSPLTSFMMIGEEIDLPCRLSIYIWAKHWPPFLAWAPPLWPCTFHLFTSQNTCWFALFISSRPCT